MSTGHDQAVRAPGAPLPAGIASIPVALAGRSYEVLIGPGLLARAAELIDTRLGPSKCVIVTDQNVAQLHLAPLESALKSRGRHAGTEVLPPGEATKSFTAARFAVRAPAGDRAWSAVAW